MRVPVVLLTGIDPTAMSTTMVGLQFDLPHAVAVRHTIDVERSVLTRTVSDVTGILEEQETFLEHACVTCAIREDILPTLERLASDGRWQSIVTHLPVGAEAAHLCSVLTVDTRLARVLRVSAVVAALSAGDPVQDLLGDDLLAERGRQCSDDDRRGAGEVLAAMIEHADLIAFDDPPLPLARGLVSALARPGVTIADGGHSLEGASLVDRLHQHGVTSAWAGPIRRAALPEVRTEGVWRLDLQSLRPFHPDRLLDSLGALGGGRHRSRGCFWLPTRPTRALHWTGAGGQLSIGNHSDWTNRTAFTRIVVTGVGVAPAEIRESFDNALVTTAESRPQHWHVTEDGYEPWLGPIDDAA